MVRVPRGPKNKYQLKTCVGDKVLNSFMHKPEHVCGWPELGNGTDCVVVAGTFVHGWSW